MCLNTKRSQTREDPANEVTEEDYSSVEPTVHSNSKSEGYSCRYTETFTSPRPVEIQFWCLSYSYHPDSWK